MGVQLSLLNLITKALHLLLPVKESGPLESSYAGFSGYFIPFPVIERCYQLSRLWFSPALLLCFVVVLTG